MEVHLIVKAMPQNMARRAVFRSADFFRNEINFYAHVIPAWERFQKRRSPQRAFKEYPVCYASYCDGENDFIALEDLNVFGYSSPIRQECISLEECVLTMSTLGRFHGISLAFRELEPEEFEKTCKCLEVSATNQMQLLLTHLLEFYSRLRIRATLRSSCKLLG